jgi:DNA-binding GntR family transcriptional regulator
MSAAVTELRSIICDKEDGAFLGGEPEVQSALGVSRTTLRQVARLLEREGLLRVQRGSRGGYYACRPSVGSIEAAVTAHLESLDVRSDELSTMASIIWGEVVQQAASLGTPATRTLSKRIAKTIQAVPERITHHGLSAVEQAIRAEICSIIDSPYIRFIFRVNIAFAERRQITKKTIPGPALLTVEQVETWREIKLLELEAIARADQELGILATQRTRKFWHALSPERRVTAK